MNTNPNATATPAQLVQVALEFRRTAQAYQAAGNGAWYASMMIEARNYAGLAMAMEVPA